MKSPNCLKSNELRIDGWPYALRSFSSDISQILKAELKRVARGALHLRKGRRVLCKAVRGRYAFIKRHEHEHSVRRMCEVMQLRYYA